MTASRLTALLFIVSTLLGSSHAARSAGCGKSLPAQQPAGQTYQTAFTQSKGTSPSRTYRIHIPSNYDENTAVPLIFSFHGHAQTSKCQEELSQFSNEAFNPNAFAVYPQGIDGTDGESSWQGAPYAKSGVNDTGYVQDMINHFNDIYCIETTQIYAAGKSNGGGFCGTLACDSSLSKQIAAFAPVSGAFYVPGSSSDACAPTTIALTCNAGRSPIPIIEFHGSADTTVPYGGGGSHDQCLPTIPHWVREWSTRDGYGLTNKTTNLYNNQVQKYEYASGSAFGTVTHYLTQGLGHAWPSTSPNSDNSAGTYFNATPLIMQFFGSHTL
ncbi:putative feruloyl esterase C [Lachnellula suecica]|uniref:feruloyl esterase n=1 Tax=Lachnellula suecica TaxID=602035 RepID=A0A8T9BYQ9_9HELO|nr:putative feruloyl esterase C [Lachnellula suecica]